MTAEYNQRRAALIAYLRVKCDQADWHGVSDAANDLRVMEAEQSVRAQSGLSCQIRDRAVTAPIANNSIDRHHELLASAKSLVIEASMGNLYQADEPVADNPSMIRMQNAIAQCETCD